MAESPAPSEQERILAAQKAMRDEWEYQIRHPYVSRKLGSSGSSSKADIDIPDERICKESVRDGYWVEKEIHPSEGRYEKD